MFIMSKANIIIPLGTEKFSVPKGFLGYIPDKFTKIDYFAALVKDGKIVIPENKKDVSVQAAEEKPIKDSRNKKAPVLSES